MSNMRNLAFLKWKHNRGETVKIRLDLIGSKLVVKLQVLRGEEGGGFWNMLLIFVIWSNNFYGSVILVLDLYRHSRWEA